MRIPNGPIVVQEGGPQPSVCVELVTTTPAMGIASDLVVSLFANTTTGTNVADAAMIIMIVLLLCYLINQHLLVNCFLQELCQLVI